MKVQFLEIQVSYEPMTEQNQVQQQQLITAACPDAAGAGNVAASSTASD